MPYPKNSLLVGRERRRVYSILDSFDPPSTSPMLTLSALFENSAATSRCSVDRVPDLRITSCQWIPRMVQVASVMLKTNDLCMSTECFRVVKVKMARKRVLIADRGR
ncbi:unnamed protein product [Toxocara canis]|uniref:Uncharacterized protein n=1 Tax=Toxocara canis TaxID=6265 RepID=A0A183VAX8_TOXCA|nr:unnamed protein product [Toxocara canis]